MFFLLLVLACYFIVQTDKRRTSRVQRGIINLGLKNTLKRDRSHSLNCEYPP